MDSALRDRVGLLCDQLSRWPTLSAIIDGAGARDELAELLGVLAGRDEPDPARVRVLLDTIDQAGARKGVVGLTSRSKGLPAGLSLPGGLAAEQAGVAGWTCGLNRCDRVVLPNQEAGTPTCAASPGTPMTPYELPAR